MTPSAGQEMIVVGVGDCRLAQPPAASLATYALGSCVAVVAWDWKLKVGGLLHVMLPDSSIDPARAASAPWAYADTGTPALLRVLLARGCLKTQLRWCLAGGAGMMAGSSHFEIGKRNHLALKKVFWRLGLFIEHEDVGGSESRSVWLNLESGRIDVRKGMGPEVALAPGALNFTKRNTDYAHTAR